MWLQILALAIGLALLIKGGDIFVSAAIRIAEFLRMPRVVIGSTLVSLTTTMPELVVSVMAGEKGESGLAVGNAVGSCICNIALILGITATIRQIDIHPRALRTPLLAMFGFGTLLLIMTLDLGLSRWQGWVLIAGGVLYFVYDFIHHARQTKPAQIAEAKSLEETIATQVVWFHTKGGSAVQFFLGAAIVVLGSRILVNAAVNLAGALGIPSIIIGLTILAVGTSLPELVTAVTSSRKNVSDLAVGNVLGANVANLSIVVGTAAAISEVRMERATQLYNFPAMLLIFGLLLWMLLSDRRITRKEGMALLVTYSLFLSGLVLLTAYLKK